MRDNSFDRVLTHLHAGRPVIVCDDDDREAEGDLLFAAAHATPILVNFTLTYARGVLCISMKEKTAERLSLRRIQSNNVDKHGTPFSVPITYADGESGVSAASRAKTILMSCDERRTSADFCMPGHVATLIARDGGLQVRDGHTEASLDLLGAANVDGNAALCEILTPSGGIAKRDYLQELSKMHDIPVIEICEIKRKLYL